MCKHSYLECELLEQRTCLFKPSQHRGYTTRGKGKGEEGVVKEKRERDLKDLNMIVTIKKIRRVDVIRIRSVQEVDSSFCLKECRALNYVTSVSVAYCEALSFSSIRANGPVSFRAIPLLQDCSSHQMPHKRSQETEARHRAAYEEKKKQMETCKTSSAENGYQSR